MMNFGILFVVKMFPQGVVHPIFDGLTKDFISVIYIWSFPPYFTKQDFKMTT